jgi:hypothetical protein
LALEYFDFFFGGGALNDENMEMETCLQSNVLPNTVLLVLMMLEMPFRGNKHILSEQAAEKRVHLFSSERCKNSSGYVCNDGG